MINAIGIYIGIDLTDEDISPIPGISMLWDNNEVLLWDNNEILEWDS